MAQADFYKEGKVPNPGYDSSGSVNLFFKTKVRTRETHGFKWGPRKTDNILEADFSQNMDRFKETEYEKLVSKTMMDSRYDQNCAWSGA